MGQACGKASLKDGGDLHQSKDIQQLGVDGQPVQTVGSWQVPSAPPGRPPLSPESKKGKKKKDKEKKGGFRGTLEALGSFGSFNGSFNERSGKDKRVGILGFEIANLVMKMMNLRVGLFEEELARFKDEVILSEASKKLIADDEEVLWTIAALDKRRELAQLHTDVARLGKQSGDAELQNLDKKFAWLGQDGEARPKLSTSEVEANIEWLQEQIATTADLYHELLALDTVNGNLKRALAEEEQFPGTQKESLGMLKQEVREQERLVRSLKKKGLWSKKLDHILDVLVELLHALHEQLIDAFFPDVSEEVLRNSPKTAGGENELGVQGLALHYANIISNIERMVSRPNSVSPASRDSLYQMLPQQTKAVLRDEINKSLEDDSVAGIRRNLDSILDIVSPVAGNTIRWCSDRRLQGHSDLCLMQTLHHADRTRTEALILELVVNLHHLMSRAKNPLNPSPSRTPSRSPIQTPPRAFVEDADVAEAMEAIPIHLRVVVEPSVVDRAESYLAKLDVIRSTRPQKRTVQIASPKLNGLNPVRLEEEATVPQREMTSAIDGRASSASDERVTSAAGAVAPLEIAAWEASPLFQNDGIVQRPGWGLTLLQKSMSAKISPVEKAIPLDRWQESDAYLRSATLDTRSRQPVFREGYVDPETRDAHNEFHNIMRGSDRRRSGESANGDGLSSNHVGLREIEGVVQREESIHTGLKDDGFRIAIGVRSNHAGLRGDEGVAQREESSYTGLKEDGFENEVSLSNGVVSDEEPSSESLMELDFRTARISSGPSTISEIEPANGHHESTLRRGFGSELQIGETSEHKLSSQRTANATARLQSYHSEPPVIAHRPSDPGPPANRTASKPPHRSQSYSGPQEPPGARKSRLSVEGSHEQSPDPRSFSESNLHGLVPKAHSGHSGELKGSKRVSHDVSHSPKTPRGPSPNSRSLLRRNSSKSCSPGSSMRGSPRALEPLSPGANIDIDLINI